MPLVHEKTGIYNVPDLSAVKVGFSNRDILPARGQPAGFKGINHPGFVLCQVQSLVGYLNFACWVVTPGRGFCAQLARATGGASAPYRKCNKGNEGGPLGMVGFSC